MNAETDVEKDPFNETMIKGPGHMLAEAREVAGLSIEEVAKELRLEPRLIAALENDDIVHLPEPTYVRGYIRAYSRMLGIDADLLLKRYGTMGHEDPEWEVPEQAKHEVAQGRSQKPFTIIMVVIIVGLLVNWLMTNGEDEAGIDEAVVSELTTALEPEPVTPEAEKPREETVSAIELEYAVSEPGPVSESQEIADADAQDGLGQPEAAEAAEPVVTELETPAAPPIEEDDRISISFTADSWVQIFDANGTQTLRGLFRKGDRKEVTGKAPFTVFLGYTPGVTLDFNGEPYDASQHTRRDSTSRFTLQAP